jgi:putative transcriptional regulator
LQAVLGTSDLAKLKWQKTGPGVAMFKLPQAEDDTGFLGLLRIDPGRKMPDHGHGGTELTLILNGAYHDEIGHFGRGDVADLDESISHTPIAAEGEPCICLVANDAPTRFRSWPARLVQRFIGI